MIVNKLFDTIDKSKLSTKTADLIKKLLNGRNRIIDLLIYFPYGYNCGREFDSDFISIYDNSLLGENIAIKVTIEKHLSQHQLSKFKKPHQIIARTKNNEVINLIFFHINKSYKERFTIGEELSISGKLENGRYGYFISHPKIEKNLKSNLIVFSKIKDGKEEEANDDIQSRFLDFNSLNETNIADDFVSISPIYGLTKGLTQNLIRNAISECLQYIENEKINLSDIMKYDFELIEKLKKIHTPQNALDLKEISKIKKDLSYLEFLNYQISLQKIKSSKLEKKFSIKNKDDQIEKFINNLPFKLTNDQKIAIDQISQDQFSKFQMFRLLQGDVGSGKTIVSLLAMLNVVFNGYNAVMMCPTTILTKQHYDNIKKLCKEFEITIAMVCGMQTASQRKKIIDRFYNNEIDILIGTNTLIYQQENFKNTALFVIDEQHRFGVEHRSNLSKKAINADILMATATPIPRTLAMTVYGDIEVSIINEKPENRKEIITKSISKNKIDAIIERIKENISQGNMVYWVVPIIQNKEGNDDISDLTTRFECLKEYFNDQIGFIHGQMKNKEIDDIMSKFQEQEIKILLATTIIEIGIDNPNATIIIIENAERFGMAQLHQLRGRVGRGSKQSYCILLHSEKISSNAMNRLKVISSTNDGFIIAEEDMKNRGSGDIFGIKQSGVREFLIADIAQDFELMKLAFKNAMYFFDNKINGLAFIEKLFQLDDNNFLNR